MFILSNRPRSNSNSEAFIKTGSARISSKSNYEIIRLANTVDLRPVFNEFNINILNNKINCPFPFHTDNTPSFVYYPYTNSYFCFGCKSSGQAVNFVADMSDISKEDAARYILTNFNSDVNLSKINDNSEFIERKKIILEYSQMIREFKFKYKNDLASFEYSEKISLIFDTVNNRNTINNDGLRILIDKLKIRLQQYKCQL